MGNGASAKKNRKDAQVPAVSQLETAVSGGKDLSVEPLPLTPDEGASFPSNNLSASSDKLQTSSDPNLNPILVSKVGVESNRIYVPKATVVATGPTRQLKVWLGTLQLERKLPTINAIRHLLFESSTASAKDADVIALLMNDLVVTEDTIDRLKRLLINSIPEIDRDNYICNEDDRALLFRNIPVLQARLSEPGQRFVYLAVAVHRRNVEDLNRDGTIDPYDCFTVPVYLTCKSTRRNEAAAHGKAVIVQEVGLHCNGVYLELVLMGAILDSDEEAQKEQLESVGRLLRARHRHHGRPFCALLWGDLNNRLVAFEELAPHVRMEDGRYELQESGVAMLAGLIETPEGRRELLAKDSLEYSGADVTGRVAGPSGSRKLLRELFSLHLDAALDERLGGGRLAVPLPSYRRTPLDSAVTDLLSCAASFVDVVCSAPGAPGGEDEAASAATPRVVQREGSSVGMESQAAYFGWQGAKKGHTSQRTIKAEKCEGSEQLYLQLGWLDGIGVYRGGVPGRLQAWETVMEVQAFDHLPVRAVVMVEPGENIPPLRVWMCTVKLERRHPTPASLEELLYGSAAASADDADVVALNFTDLEVTPDNVTQLRSLLYKALRKREEYLVNETDGGLVLRNIPAHLVAVSAEGQRFVTLSVAVHRRNVPDADRDGKNDHHDCFPVPVYLTCKSPRKNELAACGKAILGQDVVLGREGALMDLVLLGANLDTDDTAKLAQLTELARLLNAKRGSRPFCALLWGDLNNRLVAFEELAPHVHKGDGRYELQESGVAMLAGLIETPEGRRELLAKDTLVFQGKDLTGRPYCPPECNRVLQQHFALHVDAVLGEGGGAGRLEIPMPSYKRSPMDELVSLRLGRPIRFDDMVLARHLDLPGLPDPAAGGPAAAYFGWRRKGLPIQRILRVGGGPPPSWSPATAAPGFLAAGGEVAASFRLPKGAAQTGAEEERQEAVMLEAGWLEGLGVYRGSTVAAEMRAWETVPTLLAYQHLPGRAVVVIDTSRPGDPAGLPDPAGGPDA